MQMIMFAVFPQIFLQITSYSERIKETEDYMCITENGELE